MLKGSNKIKKDKLLNKKLNHKKQKEPKNSTKERHLTRRKREDRTSVVHKTVGIVKKETIQKIKEDRNRSG